VTTSPPPGAPPPAGGGGAGPEYPGGPEAPAQPPAPPPRKTSGFAIASFVLGLLGGVLLSVIFGLVALRRIRRRNLKGRGFAIAGLALSGFWTLLVVVIVVVGLSTDAERDSSGRVQEAGSESVFDLRVGDCANGVEETGEEYSVDLVPCGEPHDAEVVSSFRFPEGGYPGETEVFRVADRRCASEVGAAAPAGEPFYYYPTEDSWDRGDREVNCIAIFREPRRGSLAGP
jgi:hypothetical protein